MPGPPQVTCTCGSSRLISSANAYAGWSCPGKHTESPTTSTFASRSRGIERAHHVVVERVGAGPARALDLLHRRQPEGRAVRGEVEVERVVRRRDDAQRGVDGGDGARVRVGIVERDLVAERRLRAGDAVRAPRAHRRERERAPRTRAARRARATAFLSSSAEPRLEPIAKRAERGRVEQRVERLDVGVDRQDLDAVRAQKPGEHRHRQIRRGGIAGGRIDERDTHEGASLSTGPAKGPQMPGLPVFGGLDADRALAEVALRDLHVHARGLPAGEGRVERGAELLDRLDPRSRRPPQRLDDLLVARVLERRRRRRAPRRRCRPGRGGSASSPRRCRSRAMTGMFWRAIASNSRPWRPKLPSP